MKIYPNKKNQGDPQDATWAFTPMIEQPEEKARQQKRKHLRPDANHRGGGECAQHDACGADMRLSIASQIQKEESKGHDCREQNREARCMKKTIDAEEC